MTRARALVVDDEPDIRELLSITLGRMNLDVLTACDLTEARRILGSDEPDICLTDMRLPDGSGIDLVREISEHSAGELPVAVITAHGDMDSAVEALKAGAFDFVSKPVDLAVLRKLVSSALRLGGFEPESSAMAEAELAEEESSGAPLLVGQSSAMAGVRAQVGKLARSQAPVFINGESGTGKELVARLIHGRSARASGPFVPVNCGAIPSDLIESELFGHKKGSFTGAVADKPGLFQVADGGTLFLDEVGDLPLSMQVKMLRAIQERRVRPVGAERELDVDARILSASHKDLESLVAAGDFREDLFYRLVVIRLDVPPLRQRLSDLRELAGHFLAKHARSSGMPAQTLSQGALAALHEYEFPGNVRELENILERAVAMCDGTVISPEDLGLTPMRELTKESGLVRDSGVGISAPIPINESVEATPSRDNPEVAGERDRTERATVGDELFDGGLDVVLERVEREAILRALEKCRWNKTAAAKQLGISFGALRYRMQKLELD